MYLEPEIGLLAKTNRNELRIIVLLNVVMAQGM